MKQKGLVLIIALIALIAMSLAGISLMRTVDTTNVISGNLAFGEAAVQMEDVGEAAAYQWVISNMMTGNVATSCQVIMAANPGTICPNNAFYSPDALPINSQTKMPDLTQGLSGLAWSAALTTGIPSGYSVKYLIERMCGTNVGAATNTNGAAPSFASCMAAPVYTPATLDTNPASTTYRQVISVTLANAGTGYTTLPTVLLDSSGTGGSGAQACASITGGTVSITLYSPTVCPTGSGGSGYVSGPIPIVYGGNGTGASAINTSTGRIYFRVTVMVSGPRNTTGMAQYFIGSEDTVN